MADPQSEYAWRLEISKQAIDKQERRHITLGNTKLAIIIAGLVLAWLSLHSGLFSPYWIFAAVAIYAIAAIVHGRVIQARTRAERITNFYLRGIARIEDRWTGTGEPGERFRDPKHVYAEDLDLFGRGSVFELLSTCRTLMGEERLARWLLSASDVPLILERQKTVAELRDALNLREQLGVLGEDLRPRLDPEKLVEWSERGAILGNAGFRIVAIALAIAAVGTGCFMLATLQIWPFLGVLIVELFVWRWLQHRSITVVATLSCNADGLNLFSQILQRIETERFASARLQQITESLRSDAESASQAVRGLARIVYWIDGRESLLAHLLDLPLLYTIQLGFAADAWRRRWGAKVRAWVDSVAEMEALLSLATYSFEHPNDPFPEFVPTGGNAPAILHGTELGHPLIPSSHCVRNSVQLDEATRVFLVSGSNMSGKSTLMRTVGVNAVLAMAGAPIRGRSLQMTPVRVGSRIRTTDSLQEGRSAFYTEILRIHDVLMLTNGPARLLFLFDELLEGTNSKDRQIGANGLIRAFVERGSIGIVTTHDLALTEITAALDGQVRNMHFQDYVENGEMRFDYKLRDGVVTKSNALDLMRLIGLDV
jgi:hypothetical protein